MVRIAARRNTTLKKTLKASRMNRPLKPIVTSGARSASNPNLHTKDRTDRRVIRHVRPARRGAQSLRPASGNAEMPSTKKAPSVSTSSGVIRRTSPALNSEIIDPPPPWWRRSWRRGPGRPEGGLGEDKEGGGVPRILLQRPAVIRDHPGVPSLIDETHDQEERPGRQAVVDHLQNTAVQPGLVQREHAQHAEAEMADG